VLLFIVPHWSTVITWAPSTYRPIMFSISARSILRSIFTSFKSMLLLVTSAYSYYITVCHIFTRGLLFSAFTEFRSSLNVHGGDASNCASVLGGWLGQPSLGLRVLPSAGPRACVVFVDWLYLFIGKYSTVVILLYMCLCSAVTNRYTIFPIHIRFQYTPLIMES
jgi:hypothetical protein